MKKYLPHVVAIVLFFLTTLMYFMPQFQGKVLVQGDIVSHQGMAKETRDFKADTGEETMWTNSMFGGMPTYNISITHKNSIAPYIEKALRLGINGPAGMFLMGMISFYICMLLLRVNPWVALIFSLLFAISTSNLMLTSAGHNTKVRAIMVSAPIIAGMLLVLRQKYLLGTLIFALFLGVNLQANHPQMTFYLGMVMGIYMIIALVDAIRKGKIAEYGKAAGLLVLGGLIALGLSASKLLPTYEYGEHTMRGAPILDKSVNKGSSSATDGLSWEYAMGWSAGFTDIMSIYVPRAAGGAPFEVISSKSNFSKLTRRKKPNVPVYFGALPSTAGPYYFGAIVFFLFILGLFVVKGNVKWWMLGGLLLTLLMAMGKNAGWFNHALFDIVPLLNKFRTPNSILSISGILLVVLAGLSLDAVIKEKDKSKLLKPLLYSAGGLTVFTLLFLVVGGQMISFSSPYDGRMGMDQQVLDALLSDRKSMFSSSNFRTIGFVLATAAAIYLYIKDKLPKIALIAAVGVLALLDLAPISSSYFNKDIYKKKRSYATQFAPRDVDKQILKDTDPHYRVQDFSVDTYNSSATSYHHKTVGGYSAVKLQRIMDIIDLHLTRSQERPIGNQKVLNMLNTKYFIVPGQNNTQVVQSNPSAIGNAWFVEDVQMVPTADAEIQALNTFDPLSTAIVHDEFSDYLGGMNPSKGGTIKLTKYAPNELEYSSNASSEQLAVFSEIWYGPDLGWQAYIDDKPVDHIRANYILRAMKVPAGNHTIRFEFKPSVRATGSMISLVSSVLMLALAGFVGFSLWKNKDKIAVKTEVPSKSK